MRRMKYTRAEKLKIVKEHVIDGVSLNDLSKKYNYSTSIIKYQVQLYLLHGESIFKDVDLQKYLIEELSDVLMYYNDILRYYGISKEKLKEAYISKFTKNMARWCSY